MCQIDASFATRRARRLSGTNIVHALWLAVFVVLTGCDEQKIVVHEGKERTRPMGQRIGPPPQRGEINRMVIVIYEVGETLWTFKVVAPKSALEDESRWRPFMESVDFDEAGKPEWELPQGWQTGPSSQFVFARLNVPGTPPFEITVSDIPAGQDMAANVNRWRAQLSLPPFTDDLSNHLQNKTISQNGEDRTILVYDEEGFVAGGGMGAPTRSPVLSTQIGYDVPESWTRLDSVSPLITKFERIENEQRVEVSVTQLPAEVTTWEEVANMWGSQIGIASLTTDEVREKTSSLSIEQFEGFEIRLDAMDASPPMSIRGAMLKQGPIAWYIKLFGQSELVDEEQENLTNLIKSIKLK